MGIPTPAESSNGSQECDALETEDCGFFGIVEPEIWTLRLPVPRMNVELGLKALPLERKSLKNPDRNDKLTILKACFSSKDVSYIDITQELQELVQEDQSLTTHRSKSSGKLPQSLKALVNKDGVLSIIYQHGCNLPRIFVSDEGSFLIRIQPGSSNMVTRAIDDFYERPNHQIHILAILWGDLEVRSKELYTVVYDSVESDRPITVESELWSKLLGPYTRMGKGTESFVEVLTVYYRWGLEGSVCCASTTKGKELWIPVSLY